MKKKFMAIYYLRNQQSTKKLVETMRIEVNLYVHCFKTMNLMFWK